MTIESDSLPTHHECCVNTHDLGLELDLCQSGQTVHCDSGECNMASNSATLEYQSDEYGESAETLDLPLKDNISDLIVGMPAVPPPQYV